MFFYLGIRESNPCALCLLNFRTTVFSGFARRQPCFTLQKQLSENFPAHRVVELKKSKFFARKGKSAVNSISINEHFNALLRKICLFEPHGVRLPYAYTNDPIRHTINKTWTANPAVHLRVEKVDTLQREHSFHSYSL